MADEDNKGEMKVSQSWDVETEGVPINGVKATMEYGTVIRGLSMVWLEGTYHDGQGEQKFEIVTGAGLGGTHITLNQDDKPSITVNIKDLMRRMIDVREATITRRHSQYATSHADIGHLPLPSEIEEGPTEEGGDK